MVIDHVGIVVRTLEAGIREWVTMFGYKQRSDIVLNTRQKVRVVFMSKPNSLTVKLIEPSEMGSPIANFARRGGGLHHLCFRCGDQKLQIKLLEEQGAKLLVPPEPGEAFNEHDISFLLTNNGLSVELVDTSEKHGWRPIE